MGQGKLYVTVAVVFACSAISVVGLSFGYDSASILAIIGCIVAGARVLMYGVEPDARSTKDPPIRAREVEKVRELARNGFILDEEGRVLRPR